jgi:hypothetical protein
MDIRDFRDYILSGLQQNQSLLGAARDLSSISFAEIDSLSNFLNAHAVFRDEKLAKVRHLELLFGKVNQLKRK